MLEQEEIEIMKKLKTTTQMHEQMVENYENVIENTNIENFINNLNQKIISIIKFNYLKIIKKFKIF